MTDQPNDEHEAVHAKSDEASAGGETEAIDDAVAEAIGDLKDALVVVRRQRSEEAADRLARAAAAGLLPNDDVTDEPITGAVADVEDRYTLVINKGRNAGVKPGMIFAVLGDDANHVFDPVTGEDLGTRPGVKLRVKVTEVFKKFARAETYEIVSPQQSFGPNLGADSASAIQEYMLEAAGGLGSLGGRQRIAGGARSKDEPPSRPVVPIRVGDEVKQVG